jgi:hypothetical protein
MYGPCGLATICMLIAAVHFAKEAHHRQQALEEKVEEEQEEKEEKEE